MRASLLIAAAFGTLAAGCDDSQPTQPNRPIVVRSAVQDRLHSLSEINLKIALRRAIYDAGASCQRVDEAGYVQEYGNLSMWTASCSDRRRWAIFVGPDGTAQLRPCQQMEQLNLPRCEIKQAPGQAGAQPSAAGEQQPAG